MSNFTTQVRWIIESNSDEGLPISERINQACPKIFNFHYPIWEESYRQTLERKILMRYFNKEVGLETVGLWKFYLEERLNTIMPYYNEMYKTVSNEFNWLSPIDETESISENRESLGKVKDVRTSESKDIGIDTSTSNTEQNITDNVTSTTKSLKSDLPQANFAGVDFGTNLNEDEGESTGTNTQNAETTSTLDRNNTTNATSNNNTESENNTKNTITRNRKGNSGGKSLSELNVEYRNSLINIDNLVINELKDLFMTIYGGW